MLVGIVKKNGIMMTTLLIVLDAVRGVVRKRARDSGGRGGKLAKICKIYKNNEEFSRNWVVGGERQEIVAV